MNIPFKNDERPDINTLISWLREHGNRNAHIGGNYLVDDLIIDLMEIDAIAEIDSWDE